MNIQKLMRQAQEMQQQMQRDLAAAEFTASVGGGMVEVRVNGEKGGPRRPRRSRSARP